METECKKYGIRFLRIKPRKSWYELYNKYGFPTHRERWCNSKYKLDSFNQLKQWLRSQGQYVISYIGFCADEKARFEKRKDGSITEIYPLADFNIMESEILSWAKNESIFNGYYKYNNRCGCMFCPLADRMSLAYMAHYYPDKFVELIDLMAQTEKVRVVEYNKPFAIMDSRGKYNAEYIENNVRTKWLPKLEKMLKECDPNVDI